MNIYLTKINKFQSSKENKLIIRLQLKNKFLEEAIVNLKNIRNERYVCIEEGVEERADNKKFFNVLNQIEIHSNLFRNKRNKQFKEIKIYRN